MSKNKFNLMLLMGLALIGTILIPLNVSAHPQNIRSRNSGTVIIINNNNRRVITNHPQVIYRNHRIRTNNSAIIRSHPRKNNQIIIINNPINNHDFSGHYGWGNNDHLYYHQPLTLDNLQHSQFINLLRHNHNNNNIVSNSLRSRIFSQRNLVTQRTRRQVQRGNIFPSGVSGTVVLPRTVNSYLGFSQHNLDLVLVGSDLVFVHPSTRMVLGVVENAF
jgi:hypothetical protein